MRKFDRLAQRPRDRTSHQRRERKNTDRHSNGAYRFQPLGVADDPCGLASALFAELRVIGSVRGAIKRRKSSHLIDLPSPRREMSLFRASEARIALVSSAKQSSRAGRYAASIGAGTRR